MRKRPKLTELKFDQWADDLKHWISESVSPFEKDSLKKQAERKARARHDKLFFMRTYLPHYFHSAFGDFHEEWADFGDIKDDCAFIAAPREHAKSTFFTFGDPIHDIVFGLRNFILIVSDTNDQAVGFALPIRMEIEENPRIKHDFGDLTGSPWKAADYTTSNNVRVLARGKGEKIRGLKNRQHRPDKAIVDDFENDENVENPRLVKKGRDWLLKAVIGSLGAGFAFVMIGNIFNPKSVLSQFMADTDEHGQPLYLSRIYQAIVDDATDAARPLWPEVWPMERLMQKRRVMGRQAFNSEMQNLTTSEDSSFQEGWITHYDHSQLIVSGLQVVSFVDPSGTANAKSDFRAVVTVAKQADPVHFYVLHAWIRRGTLADMFSAAYEQFDAYGASEVGIEENMFKDFLHEVIAEQARKRGRFLPWRPVHHSANKYGRIVGTLQYLTQFGKLKFAPGQSDQDRLIEQLVFLDNANINDDGPDALEGAVSLLQTGAAGEVELW